MKVILVVWLLMLTISWKNFNLIANNTLTLGNCTDVFSEIYKGKLDLFEEFSTNLKRFFYHDYKHGVINITDVESVNLTSKIKQKIEYYNKISTILAFK